MLCINYVIFLTMNEGKIIISDKNIGAHREKKHLYTTELGILETATGPKRDRSKL